MKINEISDEERGWTEEPTNTWVTETDPFTETAQERSPATQ